MTYQLVASADPPFVSFGKGLLIRPMNQGGWEICGGDQCWELRESEYWRAVALLENPLDEVRAAFARGGCEGFPLWQVVRAGLSLSTNWARLALEWFPGLSNTERQQLKQELQSAADAPGADQNLKHRIRRLTNWAD